MFRIILGLLFLSSSLIAQSPFEPFNPNQALYAKNRISEVHMKAANGMERIERTNERGHIVQVTELSANHDTLASKHISYDSLGRVSTVEGHTGWKEQYYYTGDHVSTIYRKDAGTESYRVFQYDEEENSLHEFVDDLERAYVQFGASGFPVFYVEIDENGFSRRMDNLIHDDNGNLLGRTTFTFRNRENQFVTKEFFTLNDRGQPIESEGKKKEWTCTYTYNKRNLLERYECSGTKTDVETYSYNYFAE